VAGWYPAGGGGCGSHCLTVIAAAHRAHAQCEPTSEATSSRKKQQSAAPSASERAGGLRERKREDNAAIAIASNNNTKYRAAGGAFFQLSVPSGAAVAQTVGY